MWRTHSELWKRGGPSPPLSLPPPGHASTVASIIIIISALPPMRLAGLGVLSVADREALLRCFARRRSAAACGVEVGALVWMPAERLASELIAGRDP